MAKSPSLSSVLKIEAEFRSWNGWHGRRACAVRPLAGRNGQDLVMKTAVRKSSGASPFRAAGRRSAQASGLCYPPEWPPLLRSSGSINRLTSRRHKSNLWRPQLAMENKTSIRNFVTLMTGSAGLSRDAGTLTRKAGSLSRDPAALGGNANGLIGNPDALSSNPEALSFDTGALSFDAFHQRLDFNGLISSNLRGIASKPSKFAFSQTLNSQLTTHN